MEEITQIIEGLLHRVEKKVKYWEEMQRIRTRNEVLPDLSSLTLESEPEYLQGPTLPLGTVLHFTEGYLVVKPSPSAPLLDFETKVCREDGLVVGKIDDVIGNVFQPHYSIVAYSVLQCGQTVYYPSNSRIMASLSSKKGTDASNNNDEETSEESSSEEEPQPTQCPAKRFRVLAPPSEI